MLEPQFEEILCCYRSPSPFRLGPSVVVKCVTKHVQENAAREMVFAYCIPAVFVSGRVVNKRISHCILIACEISKLISQLYGVTKKWIWSAEKQVNLRLILSFWVL